MSAKDAFFKQLEANIDAQKANENTIRRDSMEFQKETEVLLQTIRNWFYGSPIKSKLSTTHLMIDGNKFEFESLTLENGNKILTVFPEGLYSSGALGSLSVTIDNPSRAPRTSSFKLHWQDPASNIPGWVIFDTSTPQNRVELNSDNFFSSILAFA